MSEEMFHVNRLLVAFIVFTLVLIRTGAMVMFTPFFNSESFATQIRIYFVAGLSLMLVPFASATTELPRNLDMLQLAILAGQELTVGLAIAFMSSIVFVAFRIAGEIAGQQIGFSMANVLDPVTNIEVPILGFINNNIAMALFVAAKLHLVLIYIMAKSYDFIGIGAMVPEINYNHPVLETSLGQMHDMMIIGSRLAVPIMLIMLLSAIVEGFSAKTMPQLNMQSFGMPLRVVVGVAALVFVYPAICSAIIPPDWQFNLVEMPEGPFGDMLYDLGEMVERMGQDSGGY